MAEHFLRKKSFFIGKVFISAWYGIAKIFLKTPEELSNRSWLFDLDSLVFFDVSFLTLSMLLRKKSLNEHFLYGQISCLAPQRGLKDTLLKVQ